MTFETIYLPPTANTQWRTGRAWRSTRLTHYLTTEAREWRIAFRKEFKQWMQGKQLPPAVYENGAIALKLVFSLKHDRDIDNSIKPVLDALAGVLFKDDRQVVHLDVYKQKGEPRMFVTVL